jgi:TruD family tRNA pseudouridine synthase
MEKINVDQNNATLKMERIGLKNVSIAGTKDKTARTYQRISFSMYRPVTVDMNQLGININSDLKQLFQHYGGSNSLIIRNLKISTKSIHLGELYGNRFEIIMRCHQKEQANGNNNPTNKMINLLQSRMPFVSSFGFINYYGLQRLGSSNVPSWWIGRAILKEEYNKAVQYILSVRLKEGDDVVQAKMSLNTSVKECLKLMPSRMTLEILLLQNLKRYGWESSSSSSSSTTSSTTSPPPPPSSKAAAASHEDPHDAKKRLKRNLLAKRSLLSLPRNALSMWVRSYQSYLWNLMVCERIIYERNVNSGTTTVINNSIASNANNNINCILFPKKGDYLHVSSNISLIEQCKNMTLVQSNQHHQHQQNRRNSIVIPLLGSITNHYIKSSELLMFLLNSINNKYLHEENVDDIMLLFEQQNQCCRTKGGLRYVICQPTNIRMPTIVMKRNQQERKDNATANQMEVEKNDAIKDANSINQPSNAIRIGFDLSSGSYATCCLRSMTGRNDVLF